MKIKRWTTFPNERVLWKKNKYAIVEADTLHRSGRQLIVTDGWRTAYVTLYGRFDWAMDNPQWFPNYVLDALQKVINKRGYRGN